MKTIDTGITLGALVNTHPSLARKLERLGLDYCCGGGQSLAEASTSQGLDPVMVANELAAIATNEPGPEWLTMSATELVDHLEATHHRYLKDELPRLSALVAKIVSVHGGRHGELKEIAGCYEEIRADLEPHLQKEENILFPMIRELSSAKSAPTFHCGTLQNPISVMMNEHEMVGELLAKLRKLTDGYQTPADGCATYTTCFAGLSELESDTHLHVHKENNLLFPQVLRMEQEIATAGKIHNKVLITKQN